jgi:hypothetical protein
MVLVVSYIEKTHCIRVFMLQCLFCNYSSMITNVNLFIIIIIIIIISSSSSSSILCYHTEG